MSRESNTIVLYCMLLYFSAIPKSPEHTLIFVYEDNLKFFAV